MSLIVLHSTTVIQLLKCNNNNNNKIVPYISVKIGAARVSSTVQVQGLNLEYNLKLQAVQSNTEY